MKPKKTKRKNPSDLTKRNNDARKKEIAELGRRIKRLEQILKILLAANAGG